MGVTTTLSPELVRQIIEQEEQKDRIRAVGEGMAEVVFRHGAIVGSSIERFTSLNRGMDEARQRINRFEEADDSFPSGSVILADELLGGQGRFQRWWHAPEGGLWMTLVVVNTLLPESSRLYPLAAGIACCEAVSKYFPSARIKWVNDVHVAGRKVAGILTETMIGPRNGEEYILIGIGVNVNNTNFPTQLSDLAVSMRDLLGNEIDMDLFAARLLAKLAWNIGLLHYEEGCRLQADERTGEDEHLLINRFCELCDSVGRRVRFGFDVQKAPQFVAHVREIDSSGGIVLQLDDSPELLVEHSGEIVYLD